MRSLGISVLSLALTTIVIANAYYQKKQFYPSVVYITKSNPSMAVSASIYSKVMFNMLTNMFLGYLYSGIHLCLDYWENHEENILWAITNHRI